MPVPRSSPASRSSSAAAIGRREATGRGVTYCILEALKELKLQPEQSTAVVQGFGNVGSVTCQELHQRGVRIVGVSDRYGCIRNQRGIDIPALLKHMYGPRLAGQPPRLQDFPGGEPIDSSELLTLPCTVLVPAALERVITGSNAARLSCRVLAEAANGPTNPEADVILANSDIFIIPDVLCNAGGVTVSYFEWVQDIQQFLWTEQQVNQKLQELMLRAFHQVVNLAQERKLTMRTAALSLGVEKIAREKIRRGLFP